MLVKAGAAVNIRSDEGDLPISEAIKLQNHDLAEALLSRDPKCMFYEDEAIRDNSPFF